MSYTAATTSFTYTGLASPNAFSLFASAQSPRDTYHMYEDARQVLRPSNGRTAVRKTKTSSLKKILRLTGAIA
ncbi:hypothetical protein VTO73DRAFT_14089 [Trametes versicolor]